MGSCPHPFPEYYKSFDIVQQPLTPNPVIVAHDNRIEHNLQEWLSQNLTAIP